MWNRAKTSETANAFSHTPQTYPLNVPLEDPRHTVTLISSLGLPLLPARLCITETAVAENNDLKFNTMGFP